MTRLRFLAALAFAGGLVASTAQASDWIEWRWRDALQPCGGDCAVAVYGGPVVGSNVQDIFFKGIPPWSFNFQNGGIVGGTVSRRIARVFHAFDIEGELGIAKRFGDAHETEFWEAIYVRFTEFPWNKYLYTTFAISTGINYATGISEFEKQHSNLNPPDGTRVLHFFSPEMTFAMPDRKNLQLVIRLHHRSGAYNVISRAASGATYLTAGVRFWF